MAPDILGHGKTSKPLEVGMYKGKAMAEDIYELLAHENISEVIGVAPFPRSLRLSLLRRTMLMNTGALSFFPA